MQEIAAVRVDSPDIEFEPLTDAEQAELFRGVRDEVKGTMLMFLYEVKGTVMCKEPSSRTEHERTIAIRKENDLAAISKLVQADLPVSSTMQIEHISYLGWVYVEDEVTKQLDDGFTMLAES
jgi:hypothetical protein